MSEQAYCYVKMSLYTSLNFFTNSGDKVKFWLLTFELCTPYFVIESSGLPTILPGAEP